jgi:hypothetical protein
MIICTFVLLSNLVKLHGINCMHIVISILVVLKGNNSFFLWCKVMGFDYVSVFMNPLHIYEIIKLHHGPLLRCVSTKNFLRNFKFLEEH